MINYFTLDIRDFFDVLTSHHISEIDLNSYQGFLAPEIYRLERELGAPGGLPPHTPLQVITIQGGVN